ncbi:MAG: hypothetical protein LC130_18545 [Bryobacterales bacterium]|nr:hypothetical protein [Bryobacterales bacterium]
MSALIPFLALDQACEQVQAWVNGQLTDAGFRVMETFDLHVARLAYLDCPCPYHGTDDCNCQFVVLLVYRKQEDPASLVIHGQDDKTWLSLADPVGKRASQQFETAIRRVLMPHRTNAPAPIEAAYEARSTV